MWSLRQTNSQENLNKRSIGVEPRGGSNLFSKYSFVPIDCQTVSRDDLQRLLNEAALENVFTVVYLDEVAALGQRGLEGMLLKPIDESPCIWIASAISVIRPAFWKKTIRTPGLSIEMQGRFANKVGTSLPSSPELTQWIIDRCQEWEIRIVQPEKTVPLMVKRTCLRVGYAIHILAAAAARGRSIDPDFINGFNLGPEE